MQKASHTATKRRRPPVQRERVVDSLTQLIVSGQLAPGGQLPTQKELMRRFGVESQTISDAMQLLAADGFIDPRHRRGRFVAAHPPHLSHYALTFPFSSELHNSQFYVALRAEADKLRSPQLRVSPFYDILTRHDLPDYHRLVGLIRRHALAGVIYAARPWGLWNDPILTEPEVPRVAIAAGPHEPEVPVVGMDESAFLARALAWLADRGRRRVAVLALANVGANPLERTWRPAIEQHGFETHRRWLQALPATHPELATNLVASLAYGAVGDRPDALVVTDDNLVPAATAGLALAGRQVPEDLEVVAHANFPQVTPSAVPAYRLGCDVRQVLHACFERLGQLRRGETPPAITLLPLVDEREFATARGRQETPTRTQFSAATPSGANRL